MTNVLRIGTRLSVTIRFDDRDHVVFLPDWKPPPTLDEVEATLRRGVSRTVQAVGLMDTRERPSAPIPLTPMRPTPLTPTRPTPDDQGY